MCRSAELASNAAVCLACPVSRLSCVSPVLCCVWKTVILDLHCRVLPQPSSMLVMSSLVDEVSHVTAGGVVCRVWRTSTRSIHLHCTTCSTSCSRVDCVKPPIHTWATHSCETGQSTSHTWATHSCETGQSTNNKKLSYRRWTARCVVPVEILPIAMLQCRNYLYDKS